jgi:glycosyltransferase involved in cell wall biosynthesis
MYPLDEASSGPTVRISHLRDWLSKFVDLDVVEGYRPARRRRLLAYVRSGRLRGVDGVYVETSTFLPAESDLLFLGLLRARRVPTVTYFRDAYQLFPEYYPVNTVRRWAAAHAYLPFVRSLASLSTRVAVPSAGLGRLLFPNRADLLVLPPGAPEPADVPHEPASHRLLYVGDARLAAQGAPNLLEAVRRVRAAGRDVELTIVSRAGQEPASDEEWVRLERASGAGIHALLPGVAASVIPRPRSAYNDLAVPVKLFDYLSYGRPLLVTDCREQARVVREAGAGMVVPDDPAGMAAAIESFLALQPEARTAMADAARRAAIASSWRSRALAIMSALGL